MTGSVALDVVIGLVFVYLLYSLLATILLEIIATTLSLRARNLHTAIDRMLSDEVKAEDTTLFGVKIFGSIRNDWTRKKAAWIIVDSKIMSLVWETLGDFLSFFRKPEGIFTGEFYASPEIKYQSKDTLFRKPPYLEADSFSKAIIDLFKEKGVGGTDMERIANYVATIEATHPETGKYLKSLIRDAKGDIENFKVLLEQWFDKMMFRATGWYKRKTQFVLFYVGILLAISFNVNSINIAKLLTSSPEIRDSMVKKADAYLTRHESLTLPSNTGTIPTDTAGLGKLKKMRAETQADIDSINSVLGLGWELPKGLQIAIVPRAKYSPWRLFNDNHKHLLFTKAEADEYKAAHRDAVLIKPRKDEVPYYSLAFGMAFRNGNFWGLLLTALAISLGSPFWFDLLNKLMRLRGVGSKIESADVKPEKGEKTSTTPFTVNVGSGSESKAVG